MSVYDSLEVSVLRKLLKDKSLCLSFCHRYLGRNLIEGHFHSPLAILPNVATVSDIYLYNIASFVKTFREYQT